MITAIYAGMGIPSLARPAGGRHRRQRAGLRGASTRADGLEAWKQVVERGYEGYVAKDEASAYEGGPTRRWLKVKQKDWILTEDGWQRRISAQQDGLPHS